MRYEDVYSVDLRDRQAEARCSRSTSRRQFASVAERKGSCSTGATTRNGGCSISRPATSGTSPRASRRHFADTDDDHNNLVPPPRAPLGWTKDGSVGAALRRLGRLEGADERAGTAVNLTVDGKKNQIRYQRLYSFERGSPARGGRRGGRGGRGGGGGESASISRSRSTSATYGEWTKKEGISRVDPSKPGAQTLVFDDAKFDFQKARTPTCTSTRKQTFASTSRTTTSPSADFKDGRQLTDANPQQKDFAWTSGVKLINYTSAKGDKLQGALYLPANYEPGKKYPMLVTIYEKRSNLANSSSRRAKRARRTAASTRAAATRCSIRTSSTRSTIPGMSAVWCVVPAVKAAIATGIVDSANVGLWGHSWGGYQTAFLVTQTNIFKAAIAGAPLTNMVSMYSSIYWNTGGIGRRRSSNRARAASRATSPTTSKRTSATRRSSTRRT